MDETRGLLTIFTRMQLLHLVILVHAHLRLLTGELLSCIHYNLNIKLELMLLTTALILRIIF